MAEGTLGDLRCPVSSPVGNVAGLLLGGLCVLALVLGSTIDWGVGWTTWVPALIALIPAAGLTRRRVLWRRGAGFELEQGWFFRRSRAFPADGLSIELIPTAGLWALVCHRGGAAWPVATWVTRRRAQRVAAFLDQAAPDGGWPRFEAALPAGDR